MSTPYQEDWNQDPKPAATEPDAVNFKVADPDETDAQLSELETMVRIAQSMGRDREHGRLTERAKQIGQQIGSKFNSKGDSKAFYAWGQGGSRIEGPTVNLIEALAGEWGCLSTRIDVKGFAGNDVELSIAVADLVTMTFDRRPFVFTVAPPPAKFAKKQDQAQRWRTMQMQSGISKAKRTALQHVLPEWYVSAAFDAAKAVASAEILIRTDENNNRYTVTLTEAADDAIQYYTSKIKVTIEQIEDYIGADHSKWTVSDLLNLRGLAERLRAGTETVDGVFDTETVTTRATKGKTTKAKKAKKKPAQPAEGLAALSHTPAETVDDSGDETVESVLDPETGEVIEEPAGEVAVEDFALNTGSPVP